MRIDDVNWSAALTDLVDAARCIGNATEDGALNLERALDRSLTSPNEADRNGEPANVVDGLFAIARGLNRVAKAIEGRGDP